MYKKISATLIWSENYRELVIWYLDKLGLKVIEELTHPDDTGVGLAVGESYLWIGKHSKVKGKNVDSCRHMFNIAVDSVQKVYEELKSKGVEFTGSPFKSPVSDKYFATFYDLDRNMVQLYGEL